MKERIFHYTKGIHIKNILCELEIRLSKGFKEYGEVSCVSLTTNPIFEKSILPMEPVDTKLNISKLAKNGLIKLSAIPELRTITDIQEASNIVKGFYRIEVESALDLLNWNEYRHFCRKNGRTNEAYFNSLEKVLYENSSLYDSLFSIKPIQIDKWIIVENYNVKTSEWKCLTNTNFKDILSMKDIKLSTLTPKYKRLDMLKVFNN
jgi:hypothetical protein